jgi:hypothetical protein
VDPALVMQYFGSKQELFQRAVEVTPAPGGGSGGGQVGGPDPGGAQAAVEEAVEEAVEGLLETLPMKLGELSQSRLAMLRSMLTHPEAAVSARRALGEQIDRVAETLPGEDARLRAALMTLVLLGVTVGHQLLELDELRDVPEDEIARLLRPSLRALTGQDPR